MAAVAAAPVVEEPPVGVVDVEEAVAGLVDTRDAIKKFSLFSEQPSQS